MASPLAKFMKTEAPAEEATEPVTADEKTTIAEEILEAIAAKDATKLASALAAFDDVHDAEMGGEEAEE